jgi:hypothetical protein
MKAIQSYEMVRGGISPFHYFDYYTALVHMRGAQMGQTCAETLDIEEMQKTQKLDRLR